MKAALVIVLALLLSGQLAAQWLAQPTSGIPRTPDGKPNLTAPRAAGAGWQARPLRAVVEGRQSTRVTFPRISSLTRFNRGCAIWSNSGARIGKDGMQVRCLPLGPAYATSGDITGSEMTRIVQTSQLIVMLNPDLTYRQIWMDGRALEPEPNPSWMGTPWGWDGDTLVVESYGFHPGTSLHRNGHPAHGAAAHDRAVAAPALRERSRSK